MKNIAFTNERTWIFENEQTADNICAATLVYIFPGVYHHFLAKKKAFVLILNWFFSSSTLRQIYCSSALECLLVISLHLRVTHFSTMALFFVLQVCVPASIAPKITKCIIQKRTPKVAHFCARHFWVLDFSAPPPPSPFQLYSFGNSVVVNGSKEKETH